MLAYKPSKGKLVDRIDDQQDREESDQTFQLHIVSGFCVEPCSFGLVKSRTTDFKLKGRQR